MLKTSFEKLKKYNWRLWASLCVLALVPAIYQSIRTFLISVTSSASGIDIIGQMEWYDLIDETIKAFLIVPLYAILNKVYIKQFDLLPKVIFKSLIIVVILYALFNVGVLYYGNKLVSYMNPQENDIVTISNYLKLETFAFMIGIIPSFFNVVFVVLEKSKNIYICLFVQVVMGIINDFILIPRLQVNGVAISNLITNLILAIIEYIVVYKQGFISISKFTKEDNKLFINWAKIGLFSGIQQFIDNIVYALMISRMVNMVSEQGNYWVANNFIWGWLLIPVSAMSEVIKSDCKECRKVIRSNYYLLSIFIFTIWLISVPLWLPFLRNVQQLDNASNILDILFKLVPFYIAYTLCIIPDSIFIATGHSHLNAINSMIINFAYYGIWFILYKNVIISFDMNKIILMFGYGMVVHLVVSLIEQYIYDHKYDKELVKIE